MEEALKTKLRNAKQSDIQAIAQIHVNSWKAAFDGLMPNDYIAGYTVASRMTEWQQILNSQADTVIVAENGDKVVGFMSYRNNPECKETVELDKLYLCPSVYGQKLGSRLLDHLEKNAINNKKSVVSLYVLDSNEAAIQFYSKHGFEFSQGFVSEEFPGTTIIDVQMTKPLKHSKTS